MSSEPITARVARQASYQRVRRPRRLPDEVAHAIVGDIRSGMLRPGDRLPPEHQLAASFGVSRSVVREAVSQIKHDGLLESQQGSGVFVINASQRSAFRISAECFQKRRDLRKVMELLAGVQSEAAFLAAQSRSAAQLAEMRRALARMSAQHPSSGNADARMEAEIDFHSAIAAASHNEYVLEFVEMLNARVRARLWSVACKNSRSTEMTEAVLEEHRVVHRAVAYKRPAAAREAARAHFDAAIDRLARRADLAD